MSDDNACPLCPSSGPPIPPVHLTDNVDSNADLSDDDAILSWICCTKCRSWYHGICVVTSSEQTKQTIPDLIRSHLKEKGVWTDWTAWVGRWFCHDCTASNTNLAATIDRSFALQKPLQRKRKSLDTSSVEDLSRPKRSAALNRPDYHALHHHIATPTARWLDLIKDPQKYGTVIVEDGYPRVPAGKVRKEFLESDDSFPFFGPDRQPTIITASEGGYAGLGGTIPPSNLTVSDVARLVGADRMVDVIDVATQSSAQWRLQKWADYVNSDSPSGKIYNVISLEITGTKLGDQVTPPAFVREIDWVDNYWDFGAGGKVAAIREESKVKTAAKGDPWPKVQLYCLMGAKGSWTDWHVDFAASSVYYTIHTGAKTFFFIRPTSKNLAAYAEWSGSYEKQQSVWLGDLCDEVRRVELKRGDTMIIPAGYIHAVYTPADSIVFGGNFLHSYDIPTQLRLRDIEIETKVPQRFRFPSFDRLCWYVAQKHIAQLRASRAFRRPVTMVTPSLPVLQGLISLAEFLITQCDIMDDPEAEDKRRKLVHDCIPDSITDGPALARELSWRVRRELAAGATCSVDSTGVPASGKKSALSLPRKKSRLWLLNTTAWEEQTSSPTEDTKLVVLPRPNGKDSRVAVPAEETRRAREQTRRRIRVLSDGASVLEEQTVTFVERIVVWKPESNSDPDPPV